MVESTGSVWTDKVEYRDLWDAIVITAKLFCTGADKQVVWNGTIASQRFCGYTRSISPTLLAPGAVAQVDVTLGEGLRIAGALKLVASHTNWTVWTSGLEYGYPGQEPRRVAGSLLALGPLDAVLPRADDDRVSPGGHAPAPDLPHPSELDVPGVDHIPPVWGREMSLFRYQDLHAWATPSATEKALDFVPYPPREQGWRADLVSELQELKEANKRADMEKAALAYIAGDERYAAAPFVSDVQSLGEPFSRYAEARAVVASARQQTAAAVLEQLRKLVDKPTLNGESYVTALARVWQSLYALVIVPEHAGRLRHQLIDIVVVDHILTYLEQRDEAAITAAELTGLAGASVVLCKGVFPLPRAHDVGPAPSGATPQQAALAPHAVGELQVVKQRLKRYALGEIARVQNVMQGERLTSVQRRASHVVQTDAQAVDQAITGTAARRAVSVEAEMRSAIEDTVTTATYNNFSATYGPPSSKSDDPPSTSINGSWTLEHAPKAATESASPRQKSRYAKDILERAAQRVASQVAEARSTAVLHSEDYETTSVIDNTGGGSGKRGVFRWLNEVHEAHVFNYGSRLLIEAFLPRPAAGYIAREAALPPAEFPPVPLVALGIDSYEKVTPEALPQLTTRYPSAGLRLPPPAKCTVSGWVTSGEPLSLRLPDGYASSQARVATVMGDKQATVPISGFIGSTSVSLGAPESPAEQEVCAQTFTAGVHIVSLSADVGTVQVLLCESKPACADSHSAPVRFAVEIDGTLCDSALSQWQLESYVALRAAYLAELESYRGARQAEHVGLERRVSARNIEQRELKRGTMAALLGRAIGSVEGAQADVGGRRLYLQFFERAFEWAEMSYAYFMDTTSGGSVQGAAAGGEDRFLDFLEASYAQLLLPVTPRDALAVLYFFASGSLWEGPAEGAPVHEDDLALAWSVKQLLRAPQALRPVGEPWEIVVPTTTIVLQDGVGSLGDLSAIAVDSKSGGT